MGGGKEDNPDVESLQSTMVLEWGYSAGKSAAFKNTYRNPISEQPNSFLQSAAMQPLLNLVLHIACSLERCHLALLVTSHHAPY